MSVAVGIRQGQIDRWTVFRLAWHFGFAQFGMPIVGWAAGAAVSGLLGALGQWIAAVILAVIGGRLIWEQFKGEAHKWKGDPSRGSSLIVLMFATSIDALAAGVSLALIGSDIVYPAIIIGVVAASMSTVGVLFGRVVGLRFSKGAAIFGGLILFALAVKTVV